MINVLTIVFMQWPFSCANRNLKCTHTCKQHVCTRDQMKNTKSLCALVITSISHVCSNFHWFVPYTPYITNCSRWKSFVVAEMKCNSLENFCSCIVVLCICTRILSLIHWKSFVFTNWSAKLWNFSTSTNFQYMVSLQSLLVFDLYHSICRQWWRCRQ